MIKIVVSGKSIEEALKTGLAQLNTTEDRVKMTVLEQPSKGLFGLLGVKAAKIELEKIPDPLEEAVSFLKDILTTMSLEPSVELQQAKEATTILIHGTDLGMVIGRRGQTLDALQYLVNIVANRYSEKHVRIILDAENFRDRRQQTLEQLANRLASKVIRTKKEVVLEPMPAQERKIIHSYLQSHPDVRTYSKGEEPNRRIVICQR